MTDDVKDFLSHYGVKGMKWGVRKDRESSGGSKKWGVRKDRESSGGSKKTKSDDSGKNSKKKAAIIIGSAVGIAAITIGAVYVSRKMGVSVKDIPKPSEQTKKFVAAMTKEPVGIVHAARGKNVGWTFPQRGGLEEPVVEHAKSGLADMSVNTMRRYGERSEKVASRFTDPEGRKDFAGRSIVHEVMVPESLAKNINKFEDVEPTVWPLIKDAYASLYNKDRS